MKDAKDWKSVLTDDERSHIDEVIVHSVSVMASIWQHQLTLSPEARCKVCESIAKKLGVA